MKVNYLGAENSLVSKYIYEMRHREIQRDSLRFRRNIARVGEIVSYEISRTLSYQQTEVETPLGKANAYLPETIVLGTILRAGLAFHEGFLSYFDDAENAFISAYRRYKDRLNFDIHIEYIAAPNINGKTLVLTDPMLATGSSMELAYKAILTHGEPSKLHLASVIASRQAIAYLEEVVPEEATLWVAAIDDELDEHAYIVPGLGDAGDLCYGLKL